MLHVSGVFASYHIWMPLFELTLDVGSWGMVDHLMILLLETEILCRRLISGIGYCKHASSLVLRAAEIQPEFS